MCPLIPPPPATVEPVTDLLHGVAITDPYRWLENQNSFQTRAWLSAQAEYMRDYLVAIPFRDQIARRIRELLSVEIISDVRTARDRIFFLKRSSCQQQTAITMRRDLDGEEIVLVDPATIEGTAVSVGIVDISRDGKLLAYCVRQGGEDFQSIRILDVDECRVLPDQLPRGTCRGFVFLEDLSGFIYSHEPVNEQGSHLQRNAAYRHKLGTDIRQDEETFVSEPDSIAQLCVFGAASSHYIGYLVRRDGDVRTQDFFVQDTRQEMTVRRIAQRFVGLFFPIILSDFVICLTTQEAPNGQVMLFDLRPGRLNRWSTLIRESHAKIHEVAVAGRALFVRYVENAASNVRIFGLSGDERGSLPSSSNGTTRFFPSDPGSKILFYEFSSFTTPPEICWYNPQNMKGSVWETRQVPMDTSAFSVQQQVCVSYDNARVPLSIVFHKNRKCRDVPTVLAAYGGFGQSQTPQFSTFGNVLVEKGCIFVVANVRGGAEFGDSWHRLGKRLCKQNCINDVISSAEWLIDQGFTTASQLCIAGGSNGGLLVAAALTQRPDLFRAALCIGPLLDMLRYHLFDQASKWRAEYGSAENPEDFGSLLTYSPYHKVRNDTSYPAVMFVSGDADTRCNPMHTRKMTARLQAASISDHPVLLDYRQYWGHMPVQALETRINALTDRLSFIGKELQLEF